MIRYPILPITVWNRETERDTHMKKIINRVFKALQNEEYTLIDCMALYIFIEETFPDIHALALPDAFYNGMTDYYNKNC